MSLYIVGDPSQLLFPFAGANPRILTEEVDRILANLQTVKLRVNYRSTVKIIKTFDRLNRYNYADLGGPFPQSLEPIIEPRPGADEGDPVIFNMYPDDVAEADAVAAGINEQFAFGFEPKDVFVLSRTRAQLAEIERALSEARIPFLNLTGGSFWNQKHIKTSIAYLTLAWAEWNLQQEPPNPESFEAMSNEAFQTVYNVASKYMVYPWGKDKGDYCPHRFLGAAFLDACKDDKGRVSYSGANKAYWERNSWRPGIDDLRDFVGGLVDEVSRFMELMETEDSKMNVGELLRMIVQDAMAPWLRASEGISGESDGDKLDDFASLISTASRFEDIPKFLNQVIEWVEAAQNAAKNGDWSKYVVISTIHRVKGLERDLVFSIGWCEGVDENDQPVGLLPHTFSLRPPMKQGMLPTGGKSQIYEERCLGYVAGTRAARRAVLSGCVNYRSWTLGPSRFIQELAIEK